MKENLGWTIGYTIGEMDLVITDEPVSPKDVQNSLHPVIHRIAVQLGEAIEKDQLNELEEFIFSDDNKKAIEEAEKEALDLRISDN